MASKVILFLLLALTSVILVQGRGNLSLGNNYGTHLIYHDIHEKAGIPLIKRDEEIVVNTVGNELIRAIVVQDLKGDGESYIKRGGLGQKNVTIKLKSARGSGYKFLVDVYGI